MQTPLDADSVRAYLARDWSASREAKREYWRARLERGGLREALLVTDELRRWNQLIDRTWPSETAREEDLETHRRVAEALAHTAPRETRARTSPHETRSRTAPHEARPRRTRASRVR